MTEQELRAYTDSCFQELDAKQKKLREGLGLGSHDEYKLDQDRKILTFIKEGSPVLNISIIILGTLSDGEEKTWLWGWANPSLSKELRDDSLQLKGLVQVTGYDIFKTASFKADNNLAGELSALAVNYLNGLGLYRVPGVNNQIYLALLKKESN